MKTFELLSELLVEAKSSLKADQVLTFRKSFGKDLSFSSTKKVGDSNGRQGRNSIRPETILISNLAGDSKSLSDVKNKKVTVTRTRGDKVYFKFQDDVKIQFTRYSKDGASVRSTENLKDHEFVISKGDLDKAFADLPE